MHSVKVILKDGTIISGPLWTWKPKEGWFSLINESGGDPIKIQLINVKSAIEDDVRVAINKVENVDLLERAHKEGWIV
jgi:hypothetical protein